MQLMPLFRNDVSSKRDINYEEHIDSPQRMNAIARLNDCDAGSQVTSRGRNRLAVGICFAAERRCSRVNKRNGANFRGSSPQVLNPLDAICNRPRQDAICVSQLKNARHIDQGILQQRPDVKIFLPFRFLFYRPEEVFQPQTYNRFLGKDALMSVIAGLIRRGEGRTHRTR